MKQPPVNNKLTIVEVLHNVDDGGALEELREGIADVTRAVLATGKAGTVSLTLTIDKLGACQVAIKDKIAIKPPQATKDATIFFADDDGDLSRRDPRQLQLITEARED